LAQVIISEQLDVAAGIESGSYTISITPSSLQGEINKIFDGEPFTETGVNNNDSVIVRIEFDEPIKIVESKAFFMIYKGEWSLESALSAEDLDSKSGTYVSVLSNKQYSAFKWDSMAVNSGQVKLMQLTARNLEDSIVHIGEWSFEIEKKIVSLVVLPDPPKLLPGTHLALSFGMMDEFNNYSEYNLDEDLSMTSSNPSIASFNDDTSILTGNMLGTTVINVRTASGSLSGSATASVLQDFTGEAADTIQVKVAVVYQDPVVSAGTKLHTKYGWYDPKPMVDQLVREYRQFSGGVIDFQIVEVHDDQILFTKLDSTYLTVNELVTYFNEPNWTTIRRLAEQENRIKFDYKGMVEYYDFYNKREQGIIDEIWVYSFPFGGMYESQMMGKDAIWWNSPPIRDVPENFTKLLSVMGWNYERTVDLAMHSFGHRMESAIWAAYGRWDVFNAKPNNWEIFTRIDKDLGNHAQVGNIHFPPNGTSDYDYGNTRMVESYEQNWKRYPYLLDQHKIINCSEWNCSQLGYMRWWFSRIPHFKGVTDGVLNNWWHYFVDYAGAVELAAKTPEVTSVEMTDSQTPSGFELEQNYPNPFNPTTVIQYKIPAASEVALKIFDILGREIAELVNDLQSPGTYKVTWNGKNSSNTDVSSGIYFYQVKTSSTTITKKMILVR
jgi:hypothetical protein